MVKKNSRLCALAHEKGPLKAALRKESFTEGQAEESVSVGVVARLI